MDNDKRRQKLIRDLLLYLALLALIALIVLAALGPEAHHIQAFFQGL